ncbi:hypothetical protein PROFUN_13067 [Planoprotostelium fungivorum]|uniref:Guanylate cyclase n=1 Tax=Planoprotostelium fungivorum TaxID=1890364 RepID=A0A2P6N5G6_9EUKA|nr:hypothetical protein PROFUN_13067 [Planoprotostelium fungivorum]
MTSKERKVAISALRRRSSSKQLLMSMEDVSSICQKELRTFIVNNTELRKERRSSNQLIQNLDWDTPRISLTELPEVPEKSRWIQAFHSFDKGSNGCIDHTECYHALRVAVGDNLTWSTFSRLCSAVHGERTISIDQEGFLSMASLFSKEEKSLPKTLRRRGSLQTIFSPEAFSSGQTPNSADMRELNFEMEVDWSQVKLGRMMGSGGMGQTYSATWRSQAVSVKKLNASTSQIVEDTDLRKLLLKLGRLRHSNLAIAIGLNTTTIDRYLVSEYFTNSLNEIIYSHHPDNLQGLNSRLIMYIAKEIAQGMNYLHSLRPPIIHGGLTSHNIMLDRHANIRVADAGLNLLRPRGKQLERMIGTPTCMAPEVLRGESDTEQSDVYSFSILLVEMSTRSSPFSELSLDRLILQVGKQGKRPYLPPKMNPELANLIKNCWDDNAKRRPMFCSIVNRLEGLLTQSRDKGYVFLRTHDPSSDWAHTEDPSSSRQYPVGTMLPSFAAETTTNQPTMGNHLLFCILLCILNAANATYKVISSSALSVDYNVAEITATYPQDVYLPQGAACAACNASNWWQNTSCICDYSTNSTACGTSTSSDCPSCPSLGGDSFDICGARDWIQLQLNRTYTITLPSTNNRVFARFFNSQPCRGYWIDIQTVEGRLNVASYPVGNRTVFQNTAPTPFTRPWFGGSYAYQCPNDLSIAGTDMIPFGVGTTEFAFQSSESYQSGMVRFNFTLRVFDVAPTQAPTVDVFQCQLSPPTNSPCITDRIEYRLLFKQRQVYNYYIPGCRLVTMRLYDINIDSTMSFTTDTTDYNVTRPEYTTSPNADGPRVITRSFCPPPGREGLWLLIRLNKTVSYTNAYSRFTLDSIPLTNTIDTPLFQLKPIDQLSSYDGHDLSDTSLLQIDGVTLSCQLGSSSTDRHGCTNLYQASVTMTTPILPYPDWMYQPIFDVSGASAMKANPTQNVTKILNYFYDPYVGPRTVTNYVILNYTVNYATTVFYQENDLQRANLILRHFTDSSGNDLGAALPVEYSPPTCRPERYAAASSLYNETMYNIRTTVDSSSIATLRNQIETLLTHPDWSDCLIGMTQFAVPNGNTTYQINACNRTRGTIEYNQDPCCSDQAAWSGICDFTNSFTYPTSTANGTRVAQSCSQSNCVKSLVSDFFQTKQGIRCFSSVQSDSNYRILDVYNARVCAKKIYGTDNNWEGPGRGNVTCLSDSDCPNGAPCDHGTRTCIIYNATQLDVDFTTCLFDTLADNERNYIANLIGFPEATSSYELARAYVHSPSSASKCESTIDLAGFVKNIHYQYVANALINSTRVGGFLQISGSFPSLFSFQESTKLDYTNTAQIILANFPPPPCSTNYTCNNLDLTCDGSTGQDCLDICQDGVYACMTCADDHHCRTVPGNLTMQQCLEARQCIKTSPRVPGSPIVSYYNASTPIQCQDASNSFCSEFCGFECTNSAFDISTTADGGFCYSRHVNCTTVGGKISTNTGACYFDLQRADCETAGYLFVQGDVCGSLSTPDQCFSCHTGHSSCSDQSYFYAGCNVTRKICPDEATCLSSGGYCVGQETMLRWNPSLPGRQFGVCVVPKMSAIDVGVIATCDDSRGQITSGDSCLDYQYDMAGCRSAGGNWTLPATDAATCQARTACRELLPNSQYRSTLANLFVRGFSPKSRADCTSIYNDQVTSSEWTHVYTWRKARWVTPSERRPQWRQQKAVVKQRLVRGFSVDQSLITLNSAKSFKKQITTFSELQCRFDPTIQMLDYVTCGCFGGSGGCSGLQEVASSSNRICNQSPYTVMPIPQGVAITTNYTSILQPVCSAVQLFAYSEGNFRVTQQVSLADSLVKIVQYNAFDITNEKGATIGTLLSNGITVLTDVVFAHYNVCFPLDSSVRSAPDGYVYDLATVVDGSLVPLDMIPFRDTINGICFTIVEPNRNASWFYVSHLPSWKDVDRVLYPYSTRALLYTLATFFLIASLLCVAAGVSFFFIDRRTKLKLQSYATVAFTFLFTATRCAYFYILPGGIPSNAVDYVLIVLPTFFYFSSVVQMVSTWIALATMSISKLNRQKYTNRSTNIGALIFHVFLYVVFLIIVLLFQFHPPTITPKCGRSIVYPVDNSFQKNLSLAYAVIIAVTSVAIAAFFLVFGLQTIRKFTGAAGGKVKKVTVTTFLYTAAFILHCGYVFILIFADPSIIVIFVGFTLTEVIPAIFLAVNQIQHREVLAAVKTKTSRTSKMGAMKSRRNKSEGVHLRSVQVQSFRGRFGEAENCITAQVRGKWIHTAVGPRRCPPPSTRISCQEVEVTHRSFLSQDFASRGLSKFDAIAGQEKQSQWFKNIFVLLI